MDKRGPRSNSCYAGIFAGITPGILAGIFAVSLVLSCGLCSAYAQEVTLENALQEADAVADLSVEAPVGAAADIPADAQADVMADAQVEVLADTPADLQQEEYALEADPAEGASLEQMLKDCDEMEKLSGVLCNLRRRLNESGPVVEESEDFVDVYYEDGQAGALGSGSAYWDQDVRDQTIDEIERHLKIDQAFLEAKKAQQKAEGGTLKKFTSEPEVQILTDEEIIRSVVDPDLVKQKIDLSFDNVSLGDIMRTLGDAGGINIVVDPAVKGNLLDLHLKQVSVLDALQLIGSTYDLGFKKIGGSLFVTKKTNLRDQSMSSKIITLRNVKVTQAENLVKDLVESVSVSEDLNSLIVVGAPDQLVKAQEIVDRIDHPQPQVILEAKIIEMNKNALRDLGVDWADELTSDWEEKTKTGSVLKISQISRSALQFDMAIKMLEQQDKAKVLSSPMVTTMNEKQAEIFVGDRVPYTVRTTSEGSVTTTVMFEEPGIRLRITPSIIGDDFVVIMVEPEVSYIYTWRGENDDIPWVKKRNATVHVRVKNGQPFVIGGILNQEDKKNLYKVPFVGDMPLIGNLFSYEKKTFVDTELLITVVPWIVNHDE